MAARGTWGKGVGNTGSMPSWCGMFMHSDVTSPVTKIAFSGSGGSGSRGCRKYLLSRMYKGSIFTRSCMKLVK